MKYYGGHKVGGGTYWSFASGRLVDIKQEGLLPGQEDTRYYRIPTMAVLLLGPVVGLLYVLTLPFIAIGMVVTVLLGKINIALVNLVGRTVSFGWRPVEAYLSGRKRKRKSGKHK